MKRKQLKQGITRRGFINGTLSAGLCAPYIITSTALGAEGRPAASERLVVGVIGVGKRGGGVIKEFMSHDEVQVVAICDVRKDARDDAKADVDKKYGNSDCAVYNDFRELLDRDDIDLVMVATPDHWHAIITIEACKHGKDVFCEKPLSLTIREGREMVKAARRYNRVFSSGSQRVIGDYGALTKFVNRGAIGKVKEAYVNVGGPSFPCDLPAEPVPEGLDWNMWLGPAPWAPYHEYRCAGTFGLEGKGWRCWRDYSGGMMTDWGGHKFGGALHALHLDETGPVEIIPPDGKDHELLTYIFANGIRIYHAPKDKGNIRYVGTEGEADKPGPLVQEPKGLRWYKEGATSLVEDFLCCVRTRERPFQDVEYAHRTATVCHLGNIAYLLNRPLKWDPVKERFAGDDIADQQIDRAKREPWRV